MTGAISWRRGSDGSGMAPVGLSGEGAEEEESQRR